MELNINLTNIPDVMPQVQPGQYFADIVKVEFKEASGKRKDNYNFHLKITSDGPEKGKVVFDSYTLESLVDANVNFGLIKFKKMVQSAGLPLSDKIDLDALLNKSVEIIVNSRPYEDPNTKEQKTSANVKEYVVRKS